MTAFEIVAVVGALAGLYMVWGGIQLIKSGVMTLAATPKAEALTLEWKKQFRLTTQIPGLAFFLIGLLFVTVSLGFLRPPDLIPIEFEGQIDGVDEPVTVLVRPANWELPGNTSGKINGKVYPDLSVLVLLINAPGYEPFTTSIKVQPDRQRVARLGTVELRRKFKESDLEKSVVAIPFKPPSPAATEAAAFGVAQ